jgi:hypothetical protein
MIKKIVLFKKRSLHCSISSKKNLIDQNTPASDEHPSNNRTSLDRTVPSQPHLSFFSVSARLNAVWTLAVARTGDGVSCRGMDQGMAVGVGASAASNGGPVTATDGKISNHILSV